MTIENALKLLDSLEFKSIDKDNMEYTAYFTYSSKEALEFLLRQVNNFINEEV